ncbi:MAG: PH domain-containing protein [Anaerolineae bacterium]
MNEQPPRLPSSLPSDEENLPVPEEQRTYLALSPERALYNGRATALAAGWAALSLLTVILAVAGALSPLAGLGTFLLLGALATFAILTYARPSARPRLEIMPGVARYTSGQWRRRETVVHFDRVAAASVVQGPFERWVTHTATLELTLACGAGLIVLRVPGLADASAQREAALGIAETGSLSDREYEQISLARRSVSVLEEVSEELSRMRNRLERL